MVQIREKFPYLIHFGKILAFPYLDLPLYLIANLEKKCRHLLDKCPLFCVENMSVILTSDCNELFYRVAERKRKILPIQSKSYVFFLPQGSINQNSNHVKVRLQPLKFQRKFLNLLLVSRAGEF